MLERARDDVALPVLQKLEFLLVDRALVFKFWKSLQVRVFHLHVLAIIYHILHTQSGCSPYHVLNEPILS